MANRKQRRAAQKQGLIPVFDPASRFKLEIKLSVPGGPFRGEYPASYASVVTADSEVDLLRATVAGLLQCFGFAQYDRVIAGAMASLINPLPKPVRGLVAYAIIQGQGLTFGTDEQEVCVKCGAEKQMTLAPEEEQVCQVCNGAHNDEENLLCEGRSEDPDPVMRDSTEHKPNCMGTIYEYKTIPTLTVLMPTLFEPLKPPEEAETAETPEAPTLPEDDPADYEFTTNEELDALATRESATEPDTAPDA